MDPLSLTATLVGLIAAAQQGYSLLTSFVGGVKSAPDSARSTLREVSDIYLCLKQLKDFLMEGRVAPRSQMCSIMVEQVVVVLTNLALLFSELQEVIDDLGSEQPVRIIDRIKWLSKEGDISKLLLRLQASKASLTLMVTTLTCTSVDEVNRSVLQLTSLVEQLLKENQNMSQRMKSLEATLGAVPSITHEVYSREIEYNSKQNTMQAPAFRFAFEEELKTSRVYGRAAVKNKRVSITPSTMSMGWSFLSHVTISEISDLSVISLPLSAGELRNGHYYASTTTDTIDIDTSLLHPWYNPPPTRSAFIRSSHTTMKGEIVHLYDHFDSAGETLHSRVLKKKEKLLPSVAEEQYWQGFKSQMESTYPNAPSYEGSKQQAILDPIFASLKGNQRHDPLFDRLSAMG